MTHRVILIKIPEELYREIEERAKNEGYTLVKDYIIAIILRELGRAPIPPLKNLERRLEMLERGELPPAVYDRIWKMIEAAIKEKSIEGVNIDELREILDKWLHTVMNRIERKVQDMINPFTAKVDDISRRLTDVYEKVEELETKIKNMEKQLASIQVKETKRKTGLERLREQGVVFESELSGLRNRDAFFRYLEREGAKVLRLINERVAIDPEFWTKFLEKITSIKTANEEEISKKLTKQERKLFSKLKESALIYFDPMSSTWKLIEETG